MEHRLTIKSLRDTKAECVCGKWHYLAPAFDRESGQDIRKHINSLYRDHIENSKKKEPLTREQIAYILLRVGRDFKSWYKEQLQAYCGICFSDGEQLKLGIKSSQEDALRQVMLLAIQKCLNGINCDTIPRKFIHLYCGRTFPTLIAAQEHARKGTCRPSKQTIKAKKDKKTRLKRAKS